MICFSVISAELSSASESVQPGLIIWVGLNSDLIRLMWSTASEPGLRTSQELFQAQTAEEEEEEEEEEE